MIYQLHASDEGSGFTIVLLHAFPLDSAMWEGQRDALLGAGLRVIVPDLPGFGSSPLPDDEPSLATAAQAVFDLLDDRAIGSASVAGLSMGGYVAMEMLRQQPGRIDGLALIDTKATADNEEARAHRLAVADRVVGESTCESLQSMLPALLAPGTLSGNPGVVEAVRDWIDRAKPASVAWAQRAMADRPDLLPVLRGYEGPALVMYGDQDALSPESEQDLMVEALPNVTRRVIPASGHLSALEQPASVSESLLEFAITSRR